MRFKKYVAPLLLVMLFGSLLVHLPLAIAGRASDYETFDAIVRIRQILLDEFVTKPGEQTLRDMHRRMIEGMIEPLGDPYTEYIPAVDVSAFNKRLRGEYVGIGAEVNMIEGQLTIISPMDDSPALRSGIRAGDVILRINGEPPFIDPAEAGGIEPIQQAIDKLMGEPNTPVIVRVRHQNGAEEDITIVRSHIVARTVKGIKRIGQDWNYCVDGNLGIAYIRISQFGGATAPELREALMSAQSQGLNALVLDLRSNPGGELNAAVDISDLFLAQGDIVTVRPRQGRATTHHAKGPGTLPDFPMVVLINEDSASASEIIAGALQDHGRAKVLGMRSYGKGSVQEVRVLPYGQGTLKFTTADYYLPSGRNLSRRSDQTQWGVDPTPGMVVPMSPEAFYQMYIVRHEYEIIRDPQDDDRRCVSLDWIRNTLKDVQLATAVENLQSVLTGNGWLNAGEADAGVLTLQSELQQALAGRAELQRRLGLVEQRILNLSSVADLAGSEPLLPRDVDLTQATIKVVDKMGNVIREFRLEGGNLELALRTVNVKPIDEDATQP